MIVTAPALRESHRREGGRGGRAAVPVKRFRCLQTARADRFHREKLTLHTFLSVYNSFYSGNLANMSKNERAGRTDDVSRLHPKKNYANCLKKSLDFFKSMV